MEIDFAMIDSKDSDIVAIDGCKPENIHNARVMGRVEADYLNRLLELQVYIKKVYECELIENNPIEGEPNRYDIYGLAYKEAQKELKKGTDILWYS
jgi:hypothetical protein